jgi:hypothetical protein
MIATNVSYLDHLSVLSLTTVKVIGLINLTQLLVKGA